MRRIRTLAIWCAGALVLLQPVHASSEESVLHVGPTTFSVSWRGSEADIGRPALLEWIERSATIVSGYYGGFPLAEVAIQVSGGQGERVMNGRTFGAPHALIEMKVGRGVSAQALRDDWVLVHEMTHLALPEVSDEQNWLAEGLATYVEGVARVQAGNMSAAALWSEYLADMRKGLPGKDDRGLDRTHSWARTYWGGALFCLVADVRIREQSGNRRGLQDALRAINRAGGSMRERWPALRIFATGDEATGTRVLEDLYADMRDKPYAPDLVGLWADLGVVSVEGGVRLEDGARLAAVRRAITAPAPYCNARSAATTAARQPSSASSTATASDSCSPSPSQWSRQLSSSARARAGIGAGIAELKSLIVCT
jgi:hypothetical protein